MTPITPFEKGACTGDRPHRALSEADGHHWSTIPFDLQHAGLNVSSLPAGFLYSRKPCQTGPPLHRPPSLLALPRSAHPSETPLPNRDSRGWRVVAAGEGEERVGPVRGIIVPGAVLPQASALVPLL